MSTNTPPEVGTIMKWYDLRAEVVLSSPEYLIARDDDCLHAMEHLDGEWKDNDGDVWEIVTPEVQP